MLQSYKAQNKFYSSNCTIKAKRGNAYIAKVNLQPPCEWQGKMGVGIGSMSTLVHWGFLIFSTIGALGLMNLCVMGFPAQDRIFSSISESSTHETWGTASSKSSWTQSNSIGLQVDKMAPIIDNLGREQNCLWFRQCFPLLPCCLAFCIFTWWGTAALRRLFFSFHDHSSLIQPYSMWPTVDQLRRNYDFCGPRNFTFMDFPNTKHFKIAIYSYWYKNKYYLSWIIVFIIVLTEASGSLNTMTIVGLVNKSALGMCLLPKPNDRYIHIILFVLVFVLFFLSCLSWVFVFVSGFEIRGVSLWSLGWPGINCDILLPLPLEVCTTMLDNYFLYKQNKHKQSFLASFKIAFIGITPRVWCDAQPRRSQTEWRLSLRKALPRESLLSAWRLGRWEWRLLPWLDCPFQNSHWDLVAWQ